LQAHSEAQPYYPTISDDAEVGQIFSEPRKISILWNAAFDTFREELLNMNITRKDDLQLWSKAQAKFLLAEERKKAKKPAKKEAAKTPVAGGKPPGAPKSTWADKTSLKCRYCRHIGHLGKFCCSNPKSVNYEGDKKPAAGGHPSGNKRGSAKDCSRSSDKRPKMSKEEWIQKK